jgi:hypothetical protein
MKYKIYLGLLFVVLSFNSAIGQIYNWGSITDSSKHIAGATLGWEYAAIAGVNYGYKLPVKIPVFVQTSFSVPFGKNVIDEFKSNVGLVGQLYSKKKFSSILSLNTVYKRYANELVTLNQVGLDIKTLNGFYKPKWFVATEIGLELGLSTHFKHSETYKQNIYADVQDGWYKPISAGIMNFGVQGGYSFRKSDLIFRIGYYKSITSNVNALIPYYVTLGYNLKIK